MSLSNSAFKPYFQSVYKGVELELSPFSEFSDIHEYLNFHTIHNIITIRNILKIQIIHTIHTIQLLVSLSLWYIHRTSVRASDWIVR